MSIQKTMSLGFVVILCLGTVVLQGVTCVNSSDSSVSADVLNRTRSLSSPLSNLQNSTSKSAINSVNKEESAARILQHDVSLNKANRITDSVSVSSLTKYFRSTASNLYKRYTSRNGLFQNNTTNGEEVVKSTPRVSPNSYHPSDHISSAVTKTQTTNSFALSRILSTRSMRDMTEANSGTSDGMSTTTATPNVNTTESESEPPSVASSVRSPRHTTSDKTRTSNSMTTGAALNVTKPDFGTSDTVLTTTSSSHESAIEKPPIASNSMTNISNPRQTRKTTAISTFNPSREAAITSATLLKTTIELFNSHPAVSREIRKTSDNPIIVRSSTGNPRSLPSSPENPITEMKTDLALTNATFSSVGLAEMSDSSSSSIPDETSTISSTDTAPVVSSATPSITSDSSASTSTETISDTVNNTKNTTIDSFTDISSSTNDTTQEDTTADTEDTATNTTDMSEDITDATFETTTTSNETPPETDPSTTSNTTETSPNTTESTSETPPSNTTPDTTPFTSPNVTDSTTESTSETPPSNTTPDTTPVTSPNITDSTTESTSETPPSNTTPDTTPVTTPNFTDATTETTNESTTETTADPTTETTTDPTTEPSDHDASVVIVASILGVLLLGGVLATGAVMYRRGALPWNPTNANASVRPKPISLAKFENHCNQLLETPARLGSEFQLLQTLSTDVADTHTTAAALLPDNKKKNRYTNILPFDSTRVKLDIINDDPSTDYINASFVKGYSSVIEYIACQGPKEETLGDFWRMVYQHDVYVMVMVTNFEEDGKIKCEPYLPKLREQVVSGDMVIRCAAELVFPMHTQRSLVLHKGGTKRNVTHLHFREWPDFGCPDSPDAMLQFVFSLREHIGDTPGCVLVHCSAGVGRTGTLIAVDILLQHIKASKKVDIFGTVFKLRKQRTNMVQTMGQYAYIYKCIRDAILDSSFMKTDSSPTNSLHPIYENVSTIKSSMLLLENMNGSQVREKTNGSEVVECEL